MDLQVVEVCNYRYLCCRHVVTVTRILLHTNHWHTPLKCPFTLVHLLSSSLPSCLFPFGRHVRKVQWMAVFQLCIRWPYGC